MSDEEVGPKNIEVIYERAPKLLRKIQAAIAANPKLKDLFDELALYHFKELYTAARPHARLALEEPAPKKRKLNDGEHGQNGTADVNGHSNKKKTILLEVKDASFSLPQRKKMHLGIIHIGDRLTSPENFAIWMTDPKTGDVEIEARMGDFAHALCLPVPEKAQKQYNYCFLPRPGSSTEPVLFTVPAGPLKNFMKSTEWGLAFAPPNDENPLEDALGDALRQYGMKLIKPDAVEFSSALPESHRKNEKAYHVKAFRGSKEGYLFFLSTGILFGFKKPLAFFPLEAIESISYTSVLQRTFNLNIVYKEEGKEESEEVEFSMIGVEDHTGINDYVQRHGLHDASLAVARRAKMGKSKDKSSQQNPEGDEEEDGRTELEKIEQQLQDEEDDMEEDYDPDEEDYGTGSESEDDYKEGRGRDLVGEELGSEAEDVSDDDEEEDEDVEMPTPGREEQQEGEVCDVTTSKDDDERKAHNAAVNARNNPRPVTVMPKDEPDPEDEDQL